MVVNNVIKTLAIAGGMLGALYLLRQTDGKAITAAEGTLKETVSSPLEYVQGEEGLGLTPVFKGIVGQTTSGRGRGVVPKLSLSVDEGEFGGFEFASERELMKAQLDPSQFWAVTEAGYAWTKTGRYQYKQYLKEQTRQAKATAAGFESITEWVQAKKSADIASQEAYASGIAALQTKANEGILDIVTRVITAGPSVGEVLTAGPTVGEVLTAGPTVGEVITAGPSLGEVLTAGPTLGDILHKKPSVPGTELAKGGEAVGQAREAEIAARDAEKKPGLSDPSATSSNGITSMGTAFAPYG